ncbi:MAG: T9SS type A sorting domain-containing protein [Flavobacterium sp.]|nr:T9SS type A sorting domain-containing protein [Flavobacterium sp.]
MKKHLWILLFVYVPLFGQQNNQLWKSYFSYNEIVDVANGGVTVYAATENSIFSKNTTSGNLTQTNSISGLKPESITCITRSESVNKTFIGNANGLLLVVNADGSVTQKVDIITEVPVPPNKKKINDLYEHNGRIYIATDYGISVLNALTLEFVATYFIGSNGEEVEVLQTTVKDNEIYAVTRTNGIRKGDLNNPFLFDFSQWTTFDAGFWTGIVTFNNEIIAANTNSRTFRLNGSSIVEVLNHSQVALKIKTNQSELVITTANTIFVVNQSFSTIATISTAAFSEVTPVFTAATVVNNRIFIGTEKDGLFETNLNNTSTFENISPNGPLQNLIFRVKKAPNKIWAVHGSYNQEYNPFPLDELGISVFDNDTGWNIIPYEDLLEAKSLSDIAINPNNPNEVYVSSYFSGLLKINGNNISLLNNTNTGPNGLESLVLTPPNPSYVDIRVNSPTFDREGNLWVTNAFVNRAIKVQRGTQWQSYNLQGVTANFASGRYNNMVIDKNRTKWIAAFNDGIVAFNENLNNKFININVSNGNLPDPVVTCVALDNRNQLWIGTLRGLRIVSSIDRFLTEEEIATTNIVIQEGDLAQELFFQQTILDIAVDGANRKWVSIANGGVFLVSANGQETIYRFDKNNSPLPSNTILDIEIDGASGEVFFATDKGMVSFLGTSTRPSDSLADVFVYPNPVRPGFAGTVKISGLTDRANVKITDIEGNLVFETTSAGGTIEWDTTAFGKYKVASGVYMIFVASQDGTDSTVKKVMVIR